MDIKNLVESMIESKLNEAAQPKWKVSFKSQHPSKIVSARNTAEAIKKATMSAKKTSEVASDPIYDKVEKLKEDTEVQTGE